MGRKLNFLGVVVDDEATDTENSGIAAGNLVDRSVGEQASQLGIIDVCPSLHVHVGVLVGYIADVDRVDLGVGCH